MSAFLRFCLVCLFIYHIHADSVFIINVNASNVSSRTIWNPWSTENSADYTHLWLDNSTVDNTKPTISSQYPFISRQKFAYGTGGCYKGYTDKGNKTCKTTFDLLSNPFDSNSDYNFTQLHIAIDNVIKMGLTPYIVTGLIPVSYSLNATLSDAKNLNEVPPSNYDKYGDYIYQLAKYFLNIYGATQMKSWLFGVITEYNNIHHFYDINDVNDTMEEYFKVYDYTECSLKKAFGANNFNIGAHSCRSCANGWDADELLNHIANEKNYCNGNIGDTQMDFWSSSFYEARLGNPGDQSSFNKYICSMHDVVNKYGLNKKIKEIAIDEGRILADQNGVQLQHRATAHTWQASWDSLLFYNMIKCNISRFTRWGIDTNGLGLYTSTTSQHISTIVPVAAHVATLTYKMNGDNMLHTNVTMNHDDNNNNNNNNNTQIVNGMGSLSNDGIVRVFVFNHNSGLFSTQTANVTINVCDIQNVNNDKCNVTEWMIDDNNAQFFNIYWNDVIENNITSFCPIGWSSQGEAICISDQKEHDFIESRAPIYQNASKLIPNKYSIEYKPNECIEIFKQIVPSHGVRLFEIAC